MKNQINDHDVLELTNKSLEKILTKTNLEIPVMPTIIISNEPNMIDGFKSLSYYNEQKNEIGIAYGGNDISLISREIYEEIFHYIRHIYCPTSYNEKIARAIEMKELRKEICEINTRLIIEKETCVNNILKNFINKNFYSDMVDEFYGFLGQRFYDKNVKYNNFLNHSIDSLSTKSKNIQNMISAQIQIICSIGQNLKQCKRERKQKELLDILQKSIDKYYYLTKKGYDTERLKKINQAHEIGYTHASNFDLDKINDWENFFSLPSFEVRKRFFCKNPNYEKL